MGVIQNCRPRSLLSGRSLGQQFCVDVFRSLRQFIFTRKQNFFNRQLRKIITDAVPYSELSSMPPTRFWRDHSDADLLLLAAKNGLNECGFIETIVHRRPQRGGLPIPWFIFPAIAFLDSRDLVGKKVVEIGSGYSTLYFEQRGCFGVSLENDSDWARSVGRALREISYRPRPEVQELKPAEVKNYSSGNSFGGESIIDRSLRLGISDREIDQRRFVPSLSAALTHQISDADLSVAPNSQ